MFYVETRNYTGNGSTWERLPDDKGCNTREEAEKWMDDLQEIDWDMNWKNAEYRIVEVAD